MTSHHASSPALALVSSADPGPTIETHGHDPWCDSGLGIPELADRVAGLSGRINAATCEWLGLVAEADERGAWQGHASCVAWLGWLCGIGRATAADHVRVARALRDLPAIRGAFASGALSFSQVRALTRARHLVDEEVLLDLARHATGAQLERLVRGLRDSATADEENASESRQHVTWRVDDDGSLVLSARLAGEAAATVLAALEAALAEPYVGPDVGAHAGPGGGADTEAGAEQIRPALSRVTRADALVMVATRSLASATATSDRADVATVTLVADADALHAALHASALDPTILDPSTLDLTTLDLTTDGTKASESSAEDSSGDSSPGVPLEQSSPQAPAAHGSVRWEPSGAPASHLTLVTLLCDRQLNILARLADGSLVDLGRSRRRPNAVMARAVLRRHDHACAVPACRARRHLHLHHVRHWAKGGATSVANLVPLCGRHHRDLHAGTISIESRTPGSSLPSRTPVSPWTFRDRHGVVIRPQADLIADPALPRLSADPLWAQADVTGGCIARVSHRADPLRLGYAVSVVMAAVS